MTAEIATALPDSAVLDFNLGDDTAVEIADLLLSSNVPFVFATGYGDTATIPEKFKGIPIVRKPVGRTVLADKMDAAQSAASRR